MSKTPKRQPRKRVFKKTVEVFNKHVKRKRVTDGSDKTFELLKAKYDKEIQEKERELEVLKAKRAHLIEFADESKQLGDPNAEPPKYRGLGMTEAALDAVVCLSRTLRPGKSGVTAAEVQQYLLVHGFTATTNEFPIALAVTLKRLAESGRISSRVMLGRRLFHKCASAMRRSQRSGHAPILRELKRQEAVAARMRRKIHAIAQRAGVSFR